MLANHKIKSCLRCWQHAILSTLLFLAVQPSLCQELSVKSFRLLETDLTANTHGTIEYDQNGKPAALIKVVTTETGFVFDAGMVGIVKVLEMPGEIWVYVPYTLQHITIAHPEFGIMRDYYVPMRIERARTYEMQINTVRADRSAIAPMPSVLVTFDNPSEKAGIYLNGAFMGTGRWSGLVTASTFVLEVKQEGYVTYSTVFTVDAARPEQTIIIPQLEPVKGNIMANSRPSNAKVYMDGSYIGNSPILIDNLGIGTYNLEFRMRGFHPYSTSVTVLTDETYKADAVPKRVNQNIYLGVDYQIGHITCISAYAGLYLWNYNLEMGYLKPYVSKEHTYWVTSPETWTGKTNQVIYDFAPVDAFYVSFGYGMPIGMRLCLASDAGITLYRIEGEYSSEENDITESTSNDGFDIARSYMLSASASIRLEYSPIQHLAFSISSAYEIPVYKGEQAAMIDERTDIIRTWGSGFSLKAGIKLYF